MPTVMSITSALATAMLAAAPAAHAQVTSSRDSVVNPWPNVGRASVSTDTTYIRQAIRGNLLEVALGRLAESRADDDGVEDFAERMVSDHNSMNERWGEIARNNGMKIGGAWTELDFGQTGKQTIERLEDLDGAEFDQAYMGEMIRHHEQDLAAFERMATSARSPEVRRLAGSGVPTIREHLALARQVGSRVGVATTAGRAGGVTTRVPAPSDDDRDDRGTLRGEDRAFVRNVLQDHLMHVRLAERARREARSDQTRRLAEQMEDEFEKWQERWVKVAGRYDIRAPAHLGRLHEQKVDRLERASRGNVDRTYTAIVADHLESVVPYFEKEGQAVRSAAVRRLVNDELPVIREILAGIRRMEREKK